MVAERSVTVKLKIDNSDFIRGLAEATAAAKLFEKSLGGGTSNASQGLSDVADEAAHVRREFERTSKSSLALRDAELDTAKATARLSAATSDHERALHALAHAQHEATEAINVPDIDLQREALLKLGAAQANVARTSLSLGEAQGEQSAATIAAVDAENRFQKALLSRDQAVFRAEQAAKALDKAHEDEVATDDDLTRKTLNLRAAELALERQEIDLEKQTLKVNAAHQRLGKETAEAFAEQQRLGNSLHRTGTEIDKFGKETGRATDEQKGFFAALNTSNNRMSVLLQSALALGPALVPALAAATPAVVGLTTALGFAVTGTGIAVLAFQNVGSALTAMNNFALQPTTAHLEAMNVALEKLGPAGIDFVAFIQDLRPKLEQLQAVAQAGLLPGVEQGIKEVLTELPLIQGVVSSFSSAMGDIAAATGAALTSPFWKEFFGFLRDDARTILTNFASALGHLVEGLSALIQAFGPLTDQFSVGFDNMARSFAAWAQGLSETQGFSDFILFVNRAAPIFLDTLQAAGDAIVALARAMSEIGLGSLVGLEGIFKVIAAVANSSAGPGLIAVAAGLAAISRSIALFNAVSTSALLTSLGKVKGLEKLQVSRLGAVAGGITALGLSFTSWDDNAGISNFLTFAALGATFGGIGSAIGGSIGFIIDLTKKNQDLADAMERVNQVARDTPLDFGARDLALKNLSEAMDEAISKSDSDPTSFFGKAFSANIDVAKVKLETLSGGFLDFQTDADAATQASEAFHQALVDNLALKQGLIEFNRAVEGAPKPTLGTDLNSITAAANRVIPALQGAGFSAEQIQTILTTHKGWDFAIGAAEAYISSLDSTKGRTEAVADAVSGLDDELATAADSADALGTALDAMLSPQLDLEAATDAFTTGLKQWRTELSKASKSLEGNTAAAITNRESLRSRVQEMQDQLVAEAAAGATSEQFAASLQRQRQRLIDNAKAAGLNVRQVKALLNQYGLTPKFVKTIIEAQGIDLALNNAKDLVRLYNKLPKKVRTDIVANGVDADATVRSLQEKYKGLTRIEAKTILKAVDEASGPIDKVKLKVTDLTDPKKPHTVQMKADTSQAVADLNSLESLLDRVTTPRTVTITTNTSGPKGRPKADGGLLSGPGGPRSDSIPIMASDGEFVVNAESTRRHLALLQSINNRQFAEGGQVGFARGGRVLSQSDISKIALRSDLPAFLGQLVDALADLRKEAKDVVAAERDVKAAREASREATHQLNQVQDTSSQLYRDRAKAQKAADKDLQQAEDELTKQRDQLSKATDRWRQKQQELIAQAQAVQTAVLGQGSIFGGEGSSVTVAGMLAKLNQAAKAGRQFNRNIAELRAEGLDERLIQQLLDNAGTPEAQAAAENLANATKRQIRSLNASEGQLLNVARRSGGLSVTGGGDINVKFTGNITTTDVTNLDKKLARRIKAAVRVASQK